MNIAQKGADALLRLYQLTASPLLATVMGPAGHCRFTPTCSQYARLAIRDHGIIYGGMLATGRLCRCHPWGKTGEDFPPAPFLKKAYFHGS